ncbi:hypothetical protein [Botrimarina hoheduenensis]|uniref:PEP-CTERM protein-sorting domain-containing protein n=1 Tax=Botrimarina hoheduenensis TaxID=2528000 RepID=A0A5C5VYC9_9BACT|nr:hypothetical protein [Botrimarina hoheduenensis]TWT43434.1 hypothetical protein Pla111_23850 [Botrimarina hoheduenensis]
MRTLIACMCVALGVSAANAGVTGVSVDSFPQTLGTGAIVVNDIKATFDGQLGGQQLYILLDNGTIYNTAGFGGNVAPNAAFVGLVPDLAFDSFLTMGGPTFESSQGVLVVGGAVNIMGAPSGLNVGTPNTALVSAAFAPAAGLVITDQADFLLARISISSDADGIAFFFGSTTDNAPVFEIAGTVTDGVLTFIPEPTSAVLAALAMVGGFIRRR